MSKSTLRSVYLGTILCLALLASFSMAKIFWDDHKKLSREEDALVTGRVVERSKVKVYSIATRTKLAIRVEGTDQIVFAVLLFDSSKSIPDIVHFRYDGTAGREVQLLEETKSIYAAICFGAFGIILSVVLVWFAFRPGDFVRLLKGL
jgi:hypothetical protein